MKRRHVGMAVAAAVGLLILPMAVAAEPSEPAAAGQDLAVNQAVVESLYRAFATGDGATIAAILSPTLVWIEAEGGPYADRNPYNGPGAVFEGVFGRIGAEFGGFAATPGSFHVSGDKVFAEGRYTGTNRATGEALDAQFMHVFTVSNGQITGFQQYTDTAQWVDVVTPD